MLVAAAELPRVVPEREAGAVDRLARGEDRRDGVLRAQLAGGLRGGRCGGRGRRLLGGLRCGCGLVARLVARVLDRENRGSEKRDSDEGEEEGAGDRHCLAYRQA